MVLEHAGYHEALGVGRGPRCSLEALWMGGLGSGGKGPWIQEGVENKAGITPVLEGSEARPGLHIPLHRGWGSIVDSAKFLLVSSVCELSLGFPSAKKWAL